MIPPKAYSEDARSHWSPKNRRSVIPEANRVSNSQTEQTSYNSGSRGETMRDASHKDYDPRFHQLTRLGGVGSAGEDARSLAGL